MNPYLKFLVILALPLLLAHCSDKPPPAPAAPQGRPAPVAPVLPPPEGFIAAGAEWETLAEGYIYTDGPAADAEGNVYYAEVVFNHIYKVSADGVVSQIDTDTEMTMGLVMGPDGLLYGCRNRGGKIVRYSAAGELEVLLEGELTPLPANPKAPGEFCNDMAINAEGGIWFTDRINRRVMYLSPERELRVVAEGFRPNGIVLSADRKVVAVTDSNEPVLHAFAVGEAGELTEIEGFFEPIKVVMQEGTDIIQPGTNGMTVDRDGHYYLASFYGIQIFDSGGRYVGVIRPPNEFNSNLTFGGPGYQWLYASGRNGLFRLKMQRQGVGWP